MAMNTNEGRVQYEASSGQTAFDFNFAIFENTDLLVYNTPTGQTPNDTTDILIVNTDYTVTIDGTDGGQVVLVSPATLNDVITIVRSLPIERNYDYQANGDLYADTLDSDQEYQTYLIQDGDTLLKRSVTLPQSYGGDVDLTMPPPVANGYFKYNAAGTAIEIDATIYQAVASVGGNIQDVVDVASNISNVNTVANNSNNINTVANNSNNINTVADNNTNINTIVSNIGDINSIVDDISNIDKVANNITDINTFADTYFISDTAPSSPTEGDLWFDSANNIMKVYTGSGFVAAGSSVNGTSSRNTYTATSGQTDFSATYDAGYVDVYRNGLKLAPSDFTATNGTTVVLNNACSLNDIVDIVAYGTFELADAYTKTEVDNKPTGFKNYIINGNFDIWQRKGKTQSSYLDEFTADRWKCTTVKDGVSHYAFLCSFANNRANMPHNYMAIVLQDTNANRIGFGQSIEQSSFANKNVGDYITVSFYLGHNGTSFFNSSAVMELRIYSPTAVDNWTTATLEKTFTIGTIATMPEYGTKYTVTTQLTQNMISFGFNLSFNLYVPVGTAVGSIGSTFRVSNVQLEEGSAATSFEQRPYGLELSLCQRYYKVGSGVIKKHSTSGAHVGTQPLTIPLFMRVAPTISFSKGGVITSANALEYGITKERIDIHGGADYSAASVGDYTLFSFNASAEL